MSTDGEVTEHLAGVHPRYVFDDGDLTLASSDKITFRVHASLLKHASPVFHDMISMPGPAGSTGEAHSSADVPVPLSEPAFVVEFLLDAIYPLDTLPTVKSYRGAHAIAVAADKYDIGRVLPILRSAVLDSEELRNEPLRLFSLARRRKWTAEIASSSTKSLEKPLFNSDPENLKQILELSHKDLVDLASLHARRKTAILKINTQHVSEFSINEAYYDEADPLSPEVLFNWTCFCSEVIEDDNTVISAFRMFIVVLADYLEREPMGSALFTANRSTFDQALALKALREIRCKNCGKAFFDERILWSNFDKMRKHIPMAVST